MATRDKVLKSFCMHKMIFFTYNFLGEKNSLKYFLERKSRRNCFGGFDTQFLQFGEKISEKKSFSENMDPYLFTVNIWDEFT